MQLLQSSYKLKIVEFITEILYAFHNIQMILR